MNEIKVEKTYEKRPCIVCGSWDGMQGVQFIHNRTVTEIALCRKCRGRLLFELRDKDRKEYEPMQVNNELGFYGDCPNCGLRVEHAWQEGSETKFCGYCGQRISWK